MAWTAPKTDWDSADYMNFADLNRIENNTLELATLMSLYYTIPTITVTTWDIEAVPYYDELNRIEGNIKTLQTAFGSTPAIGWTEPVTTWESLARFWYADANRIEGNLLALYDAFNNAVSEMQKCGAFIAGQDFAL